MEFGIDFRRCNCPRVGRDTRAHHRELDVRDPLRRVGFKVRLVAGSKHTSCRMTSHQAGAGGCSSPFVAARRRNIHGRTADHNIHPAAVNHPGTRSREDARNMDHSRTGASSSGPGRAHRGAGVGGFRSTASETKPMWREASTDPGACGMGRGSTEYRGGKYFKMPKRKNVAFPKAYTKGRTRPSGFSVLSPQTFVEERARWGSARSASRFGTPAEGG